MAYADYTFYKEKYFGSAVPESSFAHLAERASDWIDVATFDRLTDGLPTQEKAQTKIKKAVCALTDVLYRLETAEKNADNAAADGSSSSVGVSGISTGVVTSVSSGSESISYAAPQQIGASAKEWSAVYAAAGDPEKTNKLLMDTVRPYLLGIRTDKGIPLLYAGEWR